MHLEHVLRNSLQKHNEDIIEEYVIRYAFDNAPIVFNDNQNFKYYTNDDDV